MASSTSSKSSNTVLLQTDIGKIYNASTAGKCHASTIQFSSATYDATEGTDSNATITVTRMGAHDTIAHVNYATTDGTALPAVTIPAPQAPSISRSVRLRRLSKSRFLRITLSRTTTR